MRAERRTVGNLMSKYFDGTFLNEEYWLSYYYQVRETLKSIRNMSRENISILEIGPGNKIASFVLSRFLRTKGIKHDILSVDVDRKVKPDIVGDARYLPFKGNVFDLTLAFQVLEHIQFKQVLLALEELRRTTRKRVLLSLPHKSLYMALAIKLPKIPLKMLLLRIFDIPMRYTYDEEHYWEIGIENHSMLRVRRALEKRFKIIRSFRNPLYPYHHFFVLGHKNNS